jgi:hypothetical protein
VGAARNKRRNHADKTLALEQSEAQPREIRQSIFVSIHMFKNERECTIVKRVYLLLEKKC